MIKLKYSTRIERNRYELHARSQQILNPLQFDVKSWQLIPYDDFEMEQNRRFEVGKAVQVINPLSAEYGKNGSICSVSDSVIEVIDSKTKTTV